VSNSENKPKRILSGMRPTGRLHLGHYKGVLENWLKLQDEHQCFFFAADWHGRNMGSDRAESEVHAD